MRKLLVATTAACLAVASARAQTPDPTQGGQPLAVYLDCDFNGCDFDYFRTELTMVNWVRNRQDADVHILVTTENTGGGGREYSVNFLGLRRFSGVLDTLKYIAPPGATQDDRRKGLANVFRRGLVRYVARTPAAERLTITYRADSAGTTQTKAKADPWNYWVFSVQMNGNTNGEKNYLSYRINGNLNADRVTEGWKTRINTFESYNESDNTYPTCDATGTVCKDTTYKNYNRRYGASVLQVKSLSPHWSAGVRLTANSSTYDNWNRVLRAFPAIEYDLFPYSQSTRRQLRLEYNIGYAVYSYNDTTINDKLSESMPLQRLTVSLATREPWGSIDVGSGATHFFNGRGEYRIGTFAEVDVRLFKGLNLNGFGEYEMIRDQFALSKKSFTTAEILTRQFQRGTGYSYFGFFGLRYTFGSIFNNVVNPRMSGGFFD